MTLFSTVSSLRLSWRQDLMAGFLVFLIALPLCLGIALASGFPPMSGIISAVIGGVLVSRINGSYLSITGPAAGLIVVILSSVQNLGQGDLLAGYRLTLAAIVVAGLLQIALGLYKAGRLAAFFPISVVHGMLAAIGIIIVVKQLPVMLGVNAVSAGSMLHDIANLPASMSYFVPKIALIALFGVCFLVGWPHIRQPFLQKIPAPVLVIASGIVMGQVFDLAHLQAPTFFKQPETVSLGGPFLLSIPDSLLASFYLPDFSAAATMAFWESVVTITLVGSLETLLSAAAVDKLDPDKRYSNLNRDLAAIGVGNTLSGLVGGLPMITEIIRSSANIDNGAQSGWANFFHGAFLLLFVALFPWIIDTIPFASLAALLVYTGFRLASPQVFAKTLDLGKEQLLLFVVTIVGVLAGNLLLGVAMGIAVKLLLHLVSGVSLPNLLSISYHKEQSLAGDWHFKVSGAAIFSNFIALKSELAMLADGGTVVFDLSDAQLIDHTVMDFIDRYRSDYIARGGRCEIHGLNLHESNSGHRLSARFLK
jgi:MFS superfamily sulfate permease-like transporter